MATTGNGTIPLKTTLETYPIKSGYALQFDGSQNYVSLGTMGSQLAGKATFYISLQIKADSSKAGYYTKLYWCGGLFDWGIDSGGHPFFEFHTVSHDYNIGNYYTSTSLYDDTEHLLEIDWDGNNVNFHIDGSLVHTGSGYTDASGLATETDIGVLAYNKGNGAEFFQGIFDNFQIGTSANNLFGSYPGSRQLGSGTRLIDVSGDNNNGTLTGTPVPAWINGISAPNTVALLTTLETYPIKSGYALQFDGSQNYISLGTMGNFGSNLGSGFYCSFQIKTTQTALAEMGFYVGDTAVMLGFNATGFEVSGAGKLAFFTQSHSIVSGSSRFIGNTTNTTNFNDGNIHTIVFTASYAAGGTLTILVDGVSQAITISQVMGSSPTFQNFTEPFYLGGRYSGGLSNPLACTLDNFQIGTSANNLFGSYIGGRQAGSGTTLLDTSGKGNNGTLTGTPVPTWANGISAPNTVALLTTLQAIKNKTLALKTTLEKVVQSGNFINYVPNPSFEADTPGNLNVPNLWTFYGGNPTYTGVANDFAQYGVNSFKVSSVTTTDAGIVITVTGLPMLATVTLSAWVKTDASVVNANLTLDTAQRGIRGAATATAHVGANANSRQSISLTLDRQSVNLFIGLGSFGATSAGTVWYDGVMLEVIAPNGVSFGSYFDGNIPPAIWTGTANASTSYIPLNHVALLTILEKPQTSTVALKTILEANKRSTMPLLTTLESAPRKSTLGLKTTLSQPAKSTLALTTFLQYTKINVAILTKLEANKRSTVALTTNLAHWVIHRPKLGDGQGAFLSPSAPRGGKSKF